MTSLHHNPTSLHQHPSFNQTFSETDYRISPCRKCVLWPIRQTSSLFLQRFCTSPLQTFLVLPCSGWRSCAVAVACTGSSALCSYTAGLLGWRAKASPALNPWPSPDTHLDDWSVQIQHLHEKKKKAAKAWLRKIGYCDLYMQAAYLSSHCPSGTSNWSVYLPGTCVVKVMKDIRPNILASCRLTLWFLCNSLALWAIVWRIWI